jgi:tetratricopeptide (TPR) repeat protein
MGRVDGPKVSLHRKGRTAMTAAATPSGPEFRAARRGCRAGPSRIPPRAILAVLGLLVAVPAFAAELEEARTLFRAGRYDEAAAMAAREAPNSWRDEGWDLIRIEAELARGKYTAALRSFEAAKLKFPQSVRLRLIGRDVYRFNGRDQDAADELGIVEHILPNLRRALNAENRIAVGRYFLIRGADPRKVLDQLYDPVAKERPDLLDAYLAMAELALDKRDDALAADSLKKAPGDLIAQDPRARYLLARAFADGERSRAAKELDEALKINPNHVDSLLLRADHLIDAERLDDAGKVLDRVFAVNPSEPRGWAYRAVLAHLRNDRAGEESARKSALEHWSSNPEVDHLIGRKLSQEYRFAEGATYQRRALGFDPDHLPAKAQLCQDLLRLGDEDEGWKLADEVFAKDGYNVLAFNLVTLRDRIAGFRTLKADGLIVRMDPREAELYGDRVLSLLTRARKTLGEKYGMTPPEPIIVEIFPQRKEFAVRTFGLPGAEGFLGVCFGRVITANSPASQGEHPSNWEAVLWHEFCHVVTLHKTRNKMPRWLSEGISVYEEAQQDTAWGTPLNPKFREMLLDDSLTPLSKLSSAFLAPPSPIHLQFAYFESALAVEFLVERFGLAALKGILDDLGAGTPINESLPRRAKKTLVQLDGDFLAFARRRAESPSPGATWEQPDLPPDADADAIADWLAMHPKNFWGVQRLAARLVADANWPKARVAAEKLKGLDPGYVGPENAYMLLATIYRKTSNRAAERAILEELAARDGDAGPAFSRLIELGEQAGDWASLARNARRLLAINPLVAAPHRALGRAAEKLGARDDAIASYRALIVLDETDPAGSHYRLAKLLADAGKPAEARREVLKSLEEAPRFRDAHRLLLRLIDASPKEGR